MNPPVITKYLRLPFLFNEEKLVEDLGVIINTDWIPHFNIGSYEGNWKSIALFAENGDEKNIYALRDKASKIIETAVMKNCNYFREVINHFKCTLLSVRLLRLSAGSEIKPHSDYQLGYEDGNFRIHVPITTNPEVEFLLDGEKLLMNPGECWYTNVNYVHSVANRGKTDRIHLVIDGVRNQWSDDLFFSLAQKDSFFPVKEENYSPETILKIIEALELSSEPAAEEFIVKYRRQLNNYEL